VCAAFSAAFSGMFIIFETMPRLENMFRRASMSDWVTAPIMGAPRM